MKKKFTIKDLKLDNSRSHIPDWFLESKWQEIDRR